MPCRSIEFRSFRELQAHADYFLFILPASKAEQHAAVRNHSIELFEVSVIGCDYNPPVTLGSQELLRIVFSSVHSRFVRGEHIKVEPPHRYCQAIDGLIEI